MIKLSDRYAFTLSCALTLLSLPVLYPFFAAPVTITCRDPDRLVGERFLPSVLAFETLPQKRDLLINGSTGTVELPGKWSKKANYRISRSYDLDAYYFVPIDNFTNMFPEDQIEVRTLDVDGIELPVHLRLDESERVSVLTAYIYYPGRQADPRSVHREPRSGCRTPASWRPPAHDDLAQRTHEPRAA